MTLIATKPPPLVFQERVIATWNAFAARCNPPSAIVAAAVALTVPAMIFHDNASKDHLAVSIAGHAIAGPAGIAGHVITRLPTALSVLFGCLLIYWLLRRMSASAAALYLARHCCWLARWSSVPRRPCPQNCRWRCCCSWRFAYSGMGKRRPR
jgi:hypothetical protein